MARRVLERNELEVSCSQGVSVELRHALPKGWSVEEDADSFIVHGMRGNEWQNQLWHVVRFVAHPASLSLKRTRHDEQETRYEMLSANASGRGFRIEFILHNRQENADAEDSSATDTSI